MSNCFLFPGRPVHVELLQKVQWRLIQLNSITSFRLNPEVYFSLHKEEQRQDLDQGQINTLPKHSGATLSFCSWRNRELSFSSFWDLLCLGCTLTCLTDLFCCWLLSGLHISLTPIVGLDLGVCLVWYTHINKTANPIEVWGHAQGERAQPRLRTLPKSCCVGTLHGWLHS